MVFVVNSGLTRDSVLAAMTPNIWSTTATHKIKFKLFYIPEVQNAYADFLSRCGSISDNVEKLRQYVTNPVYLFSWGFM